MGIVIQSMDTNTCGCPCQWTKRRQQWQQCHHDAGTRLIKRQ